MSSFQIWAAKQRGNPKMLLAAAIGFTLSFYGGYRLVYRPWATRRKLQEAEEYANFLRSQDKKRAQDL